MRTAAVVCFLVAVLFSSASATLTTPVELNTTSLPVWSCVQNTSNGLFSVTKGKGPLSLASGQFNRSVDEYGWDFLRVSIEYDAIGSVGQGWYAAGFLEGYLTAERINSAWVPGASASAAKWVDAHLAFMRNEVEQKSGNDDMWRTVGYILQQLQGIADGYLASNPVPNRQLSFLDLFMINFAAEIGDVEQAVSSSRSVSNAGQVPWAQRASHCSALVKWTDDDLYVAHDTWSGYSSMTYRMFKVYDFCPTVTFSAHPGFVSSMDDWYQTSHQLAIQETTNGVMNNSLYAFVVPETVSEFLRVRAATFLAKDAESWTTYFARHNSGTYNNQYMVVDFKLFAPGSSLPDEGLLWIAEQIPGFVYRSDESKHLKYNGYWASYNIPYSPYIYQVSGFESMFEAQGSFWSYNNYARAEIFKRNQQTVRTIEDVQRLMRYNNYTHDPFSQIPNCSGAIDDHCSPSFSSMLSIASRGDLMPVYNTTEENIAHYGPLYQFVAQGCFGAIDSKIASYSNRHTLGARIISGPTSDGVPVFEWGTNGCSAAPAGPTVVDFPWIEYDLGEPRRCG